MKRKESLDGERRRSSFAVQRFPRISVMKYTIKVKTNAKGNSVVKGSEGELRVLVKAPPQEGRANEAVIEVLAAHFKIPKSRVAIVGGFKSKMKIVTIGERGTGNGRL
jgi:uncharacterized protein